MRKLLIVVVAVVLVVLVMVLALRSRSGARSLTDAENTIRRLVREVHGPDILSEVIRIEGEDAIMILTLRDSQVAELQINLSNLAHKHEEGISLEVLKLGMKSD